MIIHDVRRFAEDVLGRKVKGSESVPFVLREVRTSLRCILGREIGDSESVKEVMREYYGIKEGQTWRI